MWIIINRAALKGLQIKQSSDSIKYLFLIKKKQLFNKVFFLNFYSQNHKKDIYLQERFFKIVLDSKLNSTLI